MKRLALTAVIAAVALAAAAPAYGQTAVGDAYGGNAGDVLGTVGQGGGGNGDNSPDGISPTNETRPVADSTSAPAPEVHVAAATDSGSLPFTGLDLGLLAIGGLALLGVGIGLRRFARPLS